MQNKGRSFYFILCIIGAILGLILVGMSKNTDEVKQTGAASMNQSGVITEPKVAGMLEAMEGVSNVSVMLQIDSESHVTGVAVVCQNGEDPVIQEKIVRFLR